MGKLIYQPKGKAREYAPWACNLYNGCSNRCSYCYNRHCVGAKILGGDFPIRKKDATTDLFRKELLKYKNQIIADGEGLFFNFVSDPFLDETIVFNMDCARIALKNNVPCVFLSKKMPKPWAFDILVLYRDLVKVGFTLTGIDGLEPGGDSNNARIAIMNTLKRLNIKIWASIEPIIDIDKSFKMIQEAYWMGCRDFKIGLMNGKRNYTPMQVAHFKDTVDLAFGEKSIIYWKESVTDYISKIK